MEYLSNNRKSKSILIALMVILIISFIQLSVGMDHGLPPYESIVMDIMLISGWYCTIIGIIYAGIEADYWAFIEVMEAYMCFRLVTWLPCIGVMGRYIGVLTVGLLLAFVLTWLFSQEHFDEIARLIRKDDIRS